MPFEVFKKELVAQKGQAYVTIQREGRTIAFNEAAFVALGRPDAVELLYDRDRQVMGLRAGDVDADHTHPVRHNQRGTSHHVSGELFTKYYELADEFARRWPAEMERNVLTVDLSEPGTRVAARRKTSVTAGRNRVSPSSSEATNPDPLGRPLGRGLGKVTRFKK
jgi:hypothetical protein